MTTAYPALQGGCLCGAVRYEAAPDHRDGCYCHCRMYQLAFGKRIRNSNTLFLGHVRPGTAPDNA